MKKNQNGFGHIEALLILILVGIISFTGWFVWHSSKKANSSYSSAANTNTAASLSSKKAAKTAQTTVANNYEGWKAYTSSDGTSFKYPPSWTLASISQTSYISLKSPVDSSSGLQYQLTYGPAENRSQVLNSTVENNLALNVSLTKPLYMLAIGDNSSVLGLYVSDTSSANGSSLNPTFIGFTPRKGGVKEAFEAVLEVPNYQQDGGETLTTYQNSPDYKNVLKIFESLN